MLNVTKPSTCQQIPSPETPVSVLCGGLVYPHLLLWELKDQCAVKAALKALCEHQIRLEPNLVGPQQCCSTSWSAKVAHSFQQSLKAVVVIDHICCEHIVILVGRVGEVSFQVLTPGEGSHLGGVVSTALGILQKVKSQIRQDVWQVSSCHPGTWKRVETE